MADVCVVEGCNRYRKQRYRLCSMHQSRKTRTGEIGSAESRLIRGDDLARFFSKVNKTSTCWEWTGNRNKGYGSFGVQRSTVLAHRWLYEQVVAPIPSRLDLDHLCHNPACVNPEHLEPVTRAENLRRRNAARGWANA